MFLLSVFAFKWFFVLLSKAIINFVVVVFVVVLVVHSSVSIGIINRNRLLFLDFAF
jgi:hypothetical protein